nr:hypothetical protein [Tanacetum cinerariifolium]
SSGTGYKPSGKEEKKDVEDPENEDSEILSTKEPRVDQEEKDSVNNTNRVMLLVQLLILLTVTPRQGRITRRD